MPTVTPIKLVSAFWNGTAGEHPRLVADDSFYTFPPKIDTDIEEHLFSLDLPIIPCVDGHNVMVEPGITQFLEIDFKFCLSPNFARDLAGRTIYLGYGPEKKNDDQWLLDKRCTFPKGCRPVTSDIVGGELIENVFFTRFRCLDTSTRYANLQELISLSYDSANLYPYKLRLDTFYQDGWRLPQTEYLYVNTHADGSEYADKIDTIWRKMAGDGYKDFYNKLSASGALETMMEGGCTLIPTFEGTNGNYRVDDDFSVSGRWPGKAVPGLHDVDGQKASDAPKGTILDVLSPGYVTKNGIKPAHVIVSDGKKYDSIQRSLGYAISPDIRLPHPRSCARWGATWLPTMPHHFNNPAIWGWDYKEGYFSQQWGPLWDPLHYYYGSVTEVVKAFKTMVPESKTLAVVPHHMKKRFYPAKPLYGFDIMNEKLAKMRLEKEVLPRSGIQRINDDKVHATIGYHPLPLIYEYELSDRMFPERMPQHRGLEKMPQGLNVVPLAQVSTTVFEYRQNAPDVNEHERLTLPTMTREPSGDMFTDYPQLHRYLSSFNTALAENLSPILPGVFENNDTWDSLQEIAEESNIAFYYSTLELKKKASERVAAYLKSLETDLKGISHAYWRGE